MVDQRFHWTFFSKENKMWQPTKKKWRKKTKKSCRKNSTQALTTWQQRNENKEWKQQPSTDDWFHRTEKNVFFFFHVHSMLTRGIIIFHFVSISFRRWTKIIFFQLRICCVFFFHSFKKSIDRGWLSSRMLLYYLFVGVRQFKHNKGK